MAERTAWEEMCAWGSREGGRFRASRRSGGVLEWAVRARARADLSNAGHLGGRRRRSVSQSRHFE